MQTQKGCDLKIKIHRGGKVTKKMKRKNCKPYLIICHTDPHQGAHGQPGVRPAERRLRGSGRSSTGRHHEPPVDADDQGAGDEEAGRGDTRAAEQAHGEGEVDGRAVQVPGRGAGAGVLRPRDAGRLQAGEGGQGRGRVQQAAFQEDHTEAHRRDPGRLFFSEHLLPHGHVQVSV